MSMKYLLIWLSFLLLEACSQSNSTKQIKYFEPSLSVDGSVMPIVFDLQRDIRNDFFDNMDSVALIALETNKESLIGYIDYLTIINDTLFVVDAYKARAVLSFDLNGRYLYKIDRYGKGPGEYQSINKVYFTEKQVVILDWLSRKLIRYDLSGNFLSELHLNSEVSDLYLFGSGGLALLYDHYKDEHPFRMVITDDSLVERETAIPFTHTRQVPSDNIRTTVFEDNFLFHYALCDTIYRVTEQSIIPEYCFSFYSRSEVEDFLEQTQTLSQSDFVQALWESELVCSYSLLEMQNFLCVSYQRNFRSYISLIETKNKTVRNFSRANKSRNEIDVPCVIAGCTDRNVLLAYINESFFTQVNELDQKRFYSHLTNQQDVRLIEAVGEDTQQNPVICLLYLKSSVRDE